MIINLTFIIELKGKLRIFNMKGNPERLKIVMTMINQELRIGYRSCLEWIVIKVERKQDGNIDERVNSFFQYGQEKLIKSYERINKIRQRHQNRFINRRLNSIVSRLPELLTLLPIYLITNYMAQNLLQQLSKCSTKCKRNLGTFINKLFESNQLPHQQTDDNCAKLNIIFNTITSSFTITKSRLISKGERTQRLLVDHQYNYGQITFQSIFYIFDKIKEIRPEQTSEIFYDLGSGSGKVVLGAALCYPFQKCIGIEYLQSLYQTSKKLMERVNEKKDQLEEQIQDIEYPRFQFPELDFINADFRQANWSDGTIIFVSSTCYSKDVMVEIGNLCSLLKKGTIVITTTRKLENIAEMKIVHSFIGSTSWGNCNIFIHQKQI